MPLDAKELVLQHVFPGLGGGIALIMFLSPMKAVLEVNRTKSLGELNALPFMAMAANCLAWILYGFLCHNFYVYVANVPGLLAGLFYTLTCFKFSKEAAQDALRNLLLGVVCLYFLVGLADLAAPLDAAGSKTLWGATAVAVLGVYYTAPLTSLAKVISTRNSSSLHWPLCLMNIINGMLWFAYGLAIRDWFISLPNGVGAAFNVVCLAFCFVFPASGRSRLAGQAAAGANWSLLRLQSVRAPAGGSAAGGRDGFFDVAQMRWRAGGELLRSLSSRLSSGRRSSRQLPDAALCGGGKDVEWQGDDSSSGVVAAGRSKDVDDVAGGAAAAAAAAETAGRDLDAVKQQAGKLGVAADGQANGSVTRITASTLDASERQQQQQQQQQ